MKFALDGGSSTDSWTTPVVRRLLWINGIVFLLRFITARWVPGWSYVPLTPSAMFEHGYVWQVFTYMYDHHDVFHLVSNLFGLYVFGPDVERVMGPRRFFAYYTTCGLGAAITACVGYPNGIILGASGAFYGILLAFAVLFPYRPVLIFFMAPIEARWLAIIYGLIDVFGGLQGTSGVAHFAHLGGLATGLLIFLLSGHLRIPLFSNVVPESRSSRPSTFSKFATSIKDKVEKRRREKKKMSAQELDIILDKISKSGMNSLTREERSRLKSASTEMRKGQP